MIFILCIFHFQIIPEFLNSGASTCIISTKIARNIGVLNFDENFEFANISEN